MTKFLIAVLFFLSVICGVSANTNYYIDYTNGSDSNNGTTKSTPWKHAPGMVGCTANCGSYTGSTGGDTWILKGCVTIPAAALPWVPVYSAEIASVSIGVDLTWWDTTVTGCSTAWNRPIVDGGGSPIVGTALVDLHNFGINLSSVEFKNGAFNATTGLVYLITTQSGSGNLYTNLYMHAVTWTGTSDNCQLIRGDSHTPNLNPGAALTNSVIDLTDSVVSGKTACYAVYGGPPIEQYNVIKNVSNGLVLNGPTDVDNNLITNIGPSFQNTNCASPTYHGNGFEDNGSEGLIVYNNVIQHLAQCGVLNLWFAPAQGYTVTAWNNVSWDLDSSNSTNIIDFGNAVAASVSAGCPGGVTGEYCTYAGTYKLYNNTVECGVDSAPTNDCAQGNANATAIVFTNNHFITSTVGGSSCITGGGNCTGTTDVVQTKAVANGQGYTSAQTFVFSPTNISNSTVGTGTNLTSTGTGSLASLLYDTTYGCSEISSPYVSVFCPDRTVNGRLSSGSWDVGAYTFVAGPPGAPTSVAYTNSGSVGAHTVVVTWSPSSVSSSTYFIYRGTTPGGESGTPLNMSGVGTSCTGPTGGCTYTDSAIIAGQTWYYYVKAYSSSYYSSSSNEITTTVPVSAPTGLIISN